MDSGALNCIVWFCIAVTAPATGLHQTGIEGRPPVTFCFAPEGCGPHARTPDPRTGGGGDTVVAFLHRFLCHVLPSGFVKMRRYGLLANGQLTRRLKISRQLLAVVAAVAVVVAVPAAADTVADVLACCPACGSPRWHVIERQPRPTLPEICQLPLVPNTS